MNKRMLALILALSLATPGCLGPDHLYGGLRNWNAELSEQDWVNEVVFLGLCIIPVYPIAMLGDVVIFNTVNYWSGNNPISDPGEFPGFTKDD